MGAGRWATPAEHRADAERWRRRQAEADVAQDKKRMVLADKIVMAVVDRIAADIIRPGPKPEERECYVMAQELRDHTAHLKELVRSILDVEAKEGST